MLSLRRSIMAASVVLLPEPVEPTTSSRPRFCKIKSPKISGSCSDARLGTCCEIKRMTTAMEPRWCMALIRNRPTPCRGTPMLSSPVSCRVSISRGVTISASSERGPSTGSNWLLTGMHSPLILMRTGELTAK